MIEKHLTIINKLGLHARAATKLAATCNHFACSIKTGIGDKTVDAKSVMALMLLAAAQGTQLQFTFDGKDEAEACKAITALIADYFGEGE